MKAATGMQSCCAVLLAMLVMPAWSGEGGAPARMELQATAGAAARPSAPGWVPLPRERLAAMRGGFELPAGPAVSFGIERAAYVNGALVASTRLSIPDITHMTPQQAQALREFGAPLVIQLGGGNHFDVSHALAGGTVIQNTLDGQHVRTLTTINAGVGTLGAFQDLNSLSALQNALLIGGP